MVLFRKKLPISSFIPACLWACAISNPPNSLALIGRKHKNRGKTEQRTRVIGFRKVMGAMTFNIVALLGKDFMKLVLYGFLIAVPIFWYGMSQWLEDFAFRVGISWDIFLLAGLGAGLIAGVTVAGQAIKAALANPIRSIKNE